MIRRWPLALLALTALLGGCTPFLDGTWVAYGGTPEYRRDAINVANTVLYVMKPPVYRWGGEIRIYPTPFYCGTAYAVGCNRGENEVEVTYDPDLGLGPEVEKTALAHELCHAALDVLRNDLNEEPAAACAREVLAEFRRVYGPAPVGEREHPVSGGPESIR